MYEIVTDGSCIGNPGPGGWAAIIEQPEKDDIVIIGRCKYTTNNIMELTGIIEGLKATPKGSTVKINTDSQYCIKSMTEWYPTWVKRGFRNAAKKPIKNRDLIMQLSKLIEERNVQFTWLSRNDERIQVADAAAYGAACGRNVEGQPVA